MAPLPTRDRTRIFYRDEYVLDSVEEGFRHAFDVRKARRVRDRLIADGLLGPDDFVAAPPVSGDELALVHTDAYLAHIREPANLARLLLLDPERPWDETLLAPFLYATGGTIAAARFAAGTGGIGLNLGGGFHHAQADRGEGFCPIADVAIAARILQREELASRILIVDLDHHHGNGNAEIFAGDESVFTFSIHDNNWSWIEKRNNLDVELPSGCGDEAYLAALETHLPPVVRDFAPDAAFYLAGSDPFVEDVLGDLRVSEAGLLTRDRRVTAGLFGRGIGMAVVTAGGYGPASWRIHYNYAAWLLEDR